MYHYSLLLLFLFAMPATAQPVLVFESEPGFRLTELGELIPTIQGLFDYNGDGVRDLSLIRGDSPEDTLLVMDLTVRTVIASRPLADIEQAMGSQTFRFLGYFDIDEDGAKEAAFYDCDNQVLGLLGMLEGGMKRATQNAFVVRARGVAMLDLDDDDRAELIVGNPDTETVQVYGGNTGTATEDEIEAALAPLLENYPNPFREATTIAYEVHQAGPVTLTIYDLLGRRVRTLVEGKQAVGMHQVTWDGTDGSGVTVAAGTYFYQLQVNEAVTSKQAVRLR